MQQERLKMAGRSERVRETGQIDQLAFDDLYRQFSSSVFNFACSLTKNRGEAEDLFQETWLRVVQNFSNILDVRTFKSWVFTITVNLYRDSLRKKRVRQIFLLKRIMASAQELETPIPVDDRGQSHTSNELNYVYTSKAINQALANLPDRQRLVFILKEIEGFKYSEISEILRMPVGTLKTMIYRAVRRLRRELSAYSPKKISSIEGEKNEM